MKPITGPAVALTALALALLSGAYGDAEPLRGAVHECEPAIRTVGHATSSAVSAAAVSTRTWAVVRVTAAPNGVVRARKLVYQSGDASFNHAAMFAVSETRFTPTGTTYGSSLPTFDYFLMSSRDGSRVTQVILPLGTAPRWAKSQYDVSERHGAWAWSGGACQITDTRRSYAVNSLR